MCSRYTWRSYADEPSYRRSVVAGGVACRPVPDEEGNGDEGLGRVYRAQAPTPDPEGVWGIPVSRRLALQARPSRSCSYPPLISLTSTSPGIRNWSSSNLPRHRVALHFRIVPGLLLRIPSFPQK